MCTPENAPFANQDLEHSMELLEDLDSMKEFGDFDDDPVPDLSPAPEDPAVDQAVEDIELLLSSALMVYAFDRNRRLLDRSLRALTSCAAALPASGLRPFLGVTSPRIDALLSFTDLWQPPCWEEMICSRAGAPDEDGCFVLLQEMENALMNAGRSVPFLAFLLAGTDFPFTEEELADIRSASGTTVGEIRQTLRGKEGAEK